MDINNLLSPEVILIFLAVLLFAYVIRGNLTNYPPGPKPYPIIGNIPNFVGTRVFYRDVLKLRKIYGDIVGLKFGSQPLVFIFGPKLTHKALDQHGEDFKYRPNWLPALETVFQRRGVFFGNPPQQTVLRKFTLASLRDFGVGKVSLESRIQDEARILAEEMESYGGKPVNLQTVLKKAVANIIAGIVYGDRYDYSDPEFLTHINRVDTIFKTLSLASPAVFLPILRFLPIGKVSHAIKLFEELAEYAKGRISEHRMTFDPDNIRDFTDLYLKAEGEHDVDQAITEENMFRVVVDLFNGGTDTTATGINWLILYLTTYPEVQKKCREEIIKVVGRSRGVGLKDKNDLVYVNATIMETLRLACIAPFSAPHAVIRDVDFEGFRLPAKTMVIFHIHSTHSDPDLWNEPDAFQPERFIGEDGKLLSKSENFYPFSIGPRACLGKQLAMMELFLFLSNFLQRFEFKVPKGMPVPSTERVQSGVTCQPRPFEVCAVPY